MNSFVKNILLGILIVGLLIIGSLGIIIMGFIFFNPVPTTVTTVSKYSITFSKVPANTLNIKQKNFFNLTADDLANLPSLKTALGTFINSTDQQFTFGFPNTRSFNQERDFFNSISNGFSVFSYYNNFISFTFNQ